MYFLTAVSITAILFPSWTTEESANEIKEHQDLQCLAKDDSPWGCPLNDDLNNKHFKCEVTGYSRCRGEIRVGQGSTCYSVLTGVTSICDQGRWQSDYVPKPKVVKRVKRGWFRRRRRGSTYVAPDNPPSISCPGDVSVTAASGQTGKDVHWSGPTASDDKGTPSVTLTQGHPSGSFFSEGSTVVEYKARDSAGQEAHCHFTVTVTVTYCPALPAFHLGSRTCSGVKNNVYGSSCSYTCPAGHTLQGSRQVTCSQSGTWGSQFPSCNIISCGPPQEVRGGHMVCNQGHEYHQSCVIQCDQGYQHGGATSVTCTSSGQWTTSSDCIDVQPPVFPNGCPANQNLYSGPLRSNVTLTWDDPATSDNSQGIVTLTSKLEKGKSVGPGSYTIQITASDEAGQDSHCQFTVIVLVRECSPLSAPSNGNITCTAAAVEGSECTVQCAPCYSLQGHATLACHQNEMWNGSRANCEVITCPSPPTIAGGHLTCSEGHQCEATCHLTCDPGFTTEGVNIIHCLHQGHWTSPGSCKDTAAPVFPNGCPSHIELYASRLGQPTFANWTDPTVTDNSGDVAHLSSDVSPGSAFQVGTTVVTYKASDAMGNEGTCYMNVTVTALSCRAPSLQLTPEGPDPGNPMHSVCPDGHVHGAGCTLSCASGYRLQGRAAVTCERNDDTHPPTMTWKWQGGLGVKPLCQEDHCPPLDPPKHGALLCYHGDKSWECFLSCDASWDVAMSTTDHFSCTNERRVWWPPSAPDCVARRTPDEVRLLVDALYFTGNCDVTKNLLRQKFMERIQQTIFHSACAGIPSCVADNIKIFCGAVSTRRFRRHSDVSSDLMKRLDRARRHAGNNTSHFVHVTLHVSMPYSENGLEPEKAFKSYRHLAARVVTLLQTKVKGDGLDLDPVTSGSRRPMVEAQCPEGTVPRTSLRQTRLSCVPLHS